MIDFGGTIVSNVISLAAVGIPALAIGHRMIKNSMKAELMSSFASKEDVEEANKAWTANIDNYNRLHMYKFDHMSKTLDRLEDGMHYITRRLDEHIADQADKD